MRTEHKISLQTQINQTKQKCKECIDMSSKKNVVPEARAALEKFKMEAASEVDVNLKQGYKIAISTSTFISQLFRFH